MPSDTKVLEHARLDLDHFLPYRLSILSNRASDAIARHYSDRFGLSVPEWRIMAVLGQDSNLAPGLSARDVAQRTAMDKVQVSRAVASLVDARRVKRDGDETDGRITRLSLTSKGQAIYDEVVPLALHLEEVFLAALTVDERKTLNKLMDKLTDRIGHLHVI
ncbi:MAG TPA: MarR family winged helix-turn-helix transcriptional regulator, partial [Rhizomicrobium sp.]|nr:MarR family winged helix-turn-helix transcriptional regulator [Rhizomicrobium sp.]